MYQNINEVKLRFPGFFAQKAVKFFDRTIESTLIDGQYFITGERRPDGKREFNIRSALKTTIETIGPFDNPERAQRIIKLFKPEGEKNG